jgi:integrase/recombinase XerD
VTASVIALNPSVALLRRYLDDLVAQGRSPNTVAAYTNDLAQLVDALHRAHPGFTWNRVKRAWLHGVIDELEARNYAAATVARKIAAIKSFFHWLRAQLAIEADPTEHLDAPRVPRPVPRTLTPDQLDALLGAPLAKPRAPEPLRDAAMLRLLRATGCRVSELVGLDLDDLDLASDYVRVLGIGSRYGTRERHVPLDHLAHQVLDDYLREARPKLAGSAPTTALFLNHRGERLTRQGFWLILRGHAQAANLPGPVTPHTLRHSFAVHLLRGNASVRDVQELLGHANVATTALYVQNLPAAAAL